MQCRVLSLSLFIHLTKPNRNWHPGQTTLWLASALNLSLHCLFGLFAVSSVEVLVLAISVVLAPGKLCENISMFEKGNRKVDFAKGP